MNDEPLNPDHGAPFPAHRGPWYGVASVKWLKHIDVLTELYVGEVETAHDMLTSASPAKATGTPRRSNLQRDRASGATGLSHGRCPSAGVTASIKETATSRFPTDVR
jgi:DMSO/TMAO reductase YedYZ molybdopterin-dependent catalytic subunit